MNRKDLSSFWKGCQPKHTGKIVLNGEILKQDCYISPFLLNIIVDIPATAVRQEKEVKTIGIGEKEVKPFICSW